MKYLAIAVLIAIVVGAITTLSSTRPSPSRQSQRRVDAGR